MTFEVYVISNTVNAKQYVGITTKGYLNRFKTHKLFARKNHKRSALYDAMNKYGEDKFYVEKILDCSSFEEMNSEEVRLISEMNTLSPNGYNLTAGGDAGTFSDELKERARKARKGEKPHKNTVAAIQALWDDDDRRAEQSRLISEGMARSEKSKAAQERQRGVNKSPQHVAALRAAKASPVRCVDTGEEYEAIVDAANWLKSMGFNKATHSSILKALDYPSRSAYGYRWERV